MPLWTCPTCSKAKRGPSRPRMDNTCRFCLPCSEKAGKLVKTANLKAASQAEAEFRDDMARLAARDTRAGVNLRAEMIRVWRLPEVKALPGWQRKLPTLTIRASTTRGHWSGRACPSEHTIKMTIAPDVTRVEAVALLYHEMSHLLAARTKLGGSGRRNDWHGPGFYHTLACVIDTATGCKTVHKALDVYLDSGKRTGYAVDTVFRECLKIFFITAKM
jgi:hypothetical protein